MENKIIQDTLKKARAAVQNIKNKKGRLLRRTVCGVMIACAVFASALTGVQSASAGVLTFRGDLQAEINILVAKIQELSFIQDVLTSLDDIKAIYALKDLPNELTGMIDEVMGLKDQFAGMLDIDIEGLLNGKSDEIAKTVGDTVMNGGKAAKDSKDGKGNDSKLDEVLNGGNVTMAAEMVVERTKAGLEEVYKLTPEDKKARADKAGDSEEAAAEEAALSSIELAKNIDPLAFDQTTKIAAGAAAGSNMTAEQQILYASDMADSMKKGALAEITKVLAPYTADPESKASYRYPITEVQEKEKEALNRAADLSKGGNSQALRTIAGLSAVIVDQTSLQNQLIVKLTDVMADDVKMSGISAILAIENYGAGAQKNLQRYIDIYNKVD